MTTDDRELIIHDVPPVDPMDLYRTIMPTAVARFEASGRAAGWREAIEALRATRDRWINDDSESSASALDLSLSCQDAADFLESLAPKETP